LFDLWQLKNKKTLAARGQTVMGYFLDEWVSRDSAWRLISVGIISRWALAHGSELEQSVIRAVISADQGCYRAVIKVDRAVIGGYQTVIKGRNLLSKIRGGLV
jgi:hypothetical protein